MFRIIILKFIQIALSFNCFRILPLVTIYLRENQRLWFLFLRYRRIYHVACQRLSNSHHWFLPFMNCVFLLAFVVAGFSVQLKYNNFQTSFLRYQPEIPMNSRLSWFRWNFRWGYPSKVATECFELFTFEYYMRLTSNILFLLSILPFSYIFRISPNSSPHFDVPKFLLPGPYLMLRTLDKNFPLASHW